MATKTSTKKSGKSASRSKGFSAGERAAMKDRVKELKSNAADGEKDVLEKIAAMKEPDRSLAKRVHHIVTTTAPELSIKTWYGMPAYAKDDKVICFFKPGSKFKMRYSTLGFNDKANLDDGAMWPTEFALTKLTAPEEARISALVKKAVS